MQKSENIQNLAKALATFQANVKNPANTADNPFFKSKYAPLPDILSLVRPLLAEHGLSIMQAPSGDGDKIIITTLLMHESGEWIETDPLVLKADKPTTQGAGSAITYGRRYALSAVLGISSEDDDDGNEASKTKKTKENKSTDTPKTQTQQPPKEASGVEPCSDAQRRKIYAATKELGIEADTVKAMLADKCGVGSSKDLTKKQASEFIEYLGKLESGQETWAPTEPAELPFREAELPS